VALAAGLVVSRDDVRDSHGPRAEARQRGRSACEGNRPRLPFVVSFRLRSAAFPEAEGPSVAVHVPPGFDATRRPGVVVYFHGWQGCATVSLGRDDAPCAERSDPRPASALADQLDQANVNAVIVAIELRVDMATGESGNLARPGGLRDLLRELFSGRLAELLGCSLDVDALDRIVVIAHSGGYQAAANVLELGDLPQVTEVVLLDALYGAEDVFAGWIRDDSKGFGVEGERALRFVDLYTCCAGTAEASRALAENVAGVLPRPDAIVDDDSDRDLDRATLERTVVFKRVPGPHATVPKRYVAALLQAAGFARISDP
jgi:hypothetical protein